MSVEVATPTFTAHRFTVEEYGRMGEASVFSPDVRVELIEGEIVEMSPIGDRHAACVGWLTQTITLLLQRTYLVWAQNPVQLDNYSEPEPDILVLRPRDDFYRNGKPHPEDVLLLIEVSDSTLGFDRKRKVPLYARAGIPEVWIVNLNEERVEMFAEPSGGAYQTSAAFSRGEEVQSRSLAALRLGVSEIFG
ncbi:MAG: Uma2 family endonuclease [Pyrinomonadaceae bacterium]